MREPVPLMTVHLCFFHPTGASSTQSSLIPSTMTLLFLAVAVSLVLLAANLFVVVATFNLVVSSTS